MNLNMIKKVFSVFALVIVNFTILSAQPQVDIPMTFGDGVALNPQIRFGLGLTMTNCIDFPWESDLPPFPPLGAFDARFDLQPYCGEALSSYQDYRPVSAFPFSDSVEHRIIWQLSDFPGVNGFQIGYNLPPNITIRIIDEFNGLIFDSGILSDSGLYIITAPLQAARMKVFYFNVIPVELTSFSTSVIGSNTIQLNWTTATELNNRGFEVQRKTDNTDWQTLAFVDGHGTTTEPQSYSFIDNTVVSNTKYYYRLKQNDFDGKFSYSNVIEIDLGSPKDYSLEQNYPNPFNPSTNISFTLPKKSNVRLTIYNQLGEVVNQLVNQNLEAGKYIYSWNAASHSSGIYLYELQADEFKQIKKMSLLK